MQRYSSQASAYLKMSLLSALLCLRELAVLAHLFLIVLVFWPSTNVKRVSGPRKVSQSPPQFLPLGASGVSPPEVF